MGSVHLAKDLRVNRNVAIKRLHESSAVQLSIKNEAILLAQLNHPNIVQLYDLVEEAEDASTNSTFIALVMEYVEGQTLNHIMRGGNYTIEQATRWLIEIADALSAAHQKNIIHRDLKAENVLISLNQQVKVADFGIARIQAGAAQVDTNAFGSYTALAPEQVSSGVTDVKTDLFALGLLAYQLYCGKHPFGRTDLPAQIIHNTLYETFEPPEKLNRNIPDAIAELITALLNKKPSDRPHSAALISTILTQHLGEMDDNNHNSDTVDLSQSQLSEPYLLRSTPSPSKQNHSVGSRAFEHFRRQTVAYVLIASISIVALAVVSLWTISSQKNVGQPKYIAVLPPIFIDPEQTNSRRFSHIAATLQNALEHVIIGNSALQLVPQREIINRDKNIELLGKTTGANTVLQTLIHCIDTRCEVTLSRIDEKNWSINSQKQWPILTNDNWNTVSSTQINAAKLLNIPLSETTSQLISEKSYDKFILLRTQYSSSPTNFVHILGELSPIIMDAPHYIPLYHFFGELCIQAYDLTRDPIYLDNFSRLATQNQKLIPNDTTLLSFEFEISLLKNDAQKAEATLKKLEKRNLPNDLVLFNRARIFELEGNYTQSIALYRKAIRLRPRERYYQYLIVSLWQKGDYHAAKVSIQELNDISPNNEHGNAMLGSIALLQGELSNAIDIYERLVVHHNSSQNRSDLGVAYLLDGKYEKSLENFSFALESSPENSTYLLNYADAKLALDQRSDAQNAYKNVIDSLNKEKDLNIEQKINLAQAYARTRQSHTAINIIQDLLATDSNNANVLLAAAIVYSIVNEYQTAMVFIKRAINAGVGEIWFHLPSFQQLCSHPDIEALKQNLGVDVFCKT